MYHIICLSVRTCWSLNLFLGNFYLTMLKGVNLILNLYVCIKNVHILWAGFLSSFFSNATSNMHIKFKYVVPDKKRTLNRNSVRDRYIL